MSEEMILAYVENKKIDTWRIDISHVAIEQESLDCNTFGFDLSQCTRIGIRFPFIMRQPCGRLLKVVAGCQDFCTFVVSFA